MHDRNEKVLVSKGVLADLIAEHFELLERYRALQIQCGIAKEEAVPARKQLQKLDYVVGEVLFGLLTREGPLDYALGMYESVRGEIVRVITEKNPKRQERIQRRDLPGKIPKTSRRLFEAIGKQGISNAASLSGELEVAKGTIAKQVAPLLTIDVVKRQTSTPLVGKRNWEYNYKLSTRGRYAHFDLMEVKPREYDYSPESERYKHHLATNLVAYSLKDYKPTGFYFGMDSECISETSNHGVKTTIAPDTAGWWGKRMTCVEIESGNDFYSFGRTMKKYLLSDVRTLLVVPMSKSFLSNYIDMAKNTCVEGEPPTDEPLEVFVITLQDLIDGLEPELVAVRNRRSTPGRVR